MGKVLSRRSTKSAFNGSTTVLKASVEFSVEFAGGKEAKQPFEIPVTSEEVAQLEIGVGQIERVEEEKVEVEEE